MRVMPNFSPCILAALKPFREKCGILDDDGVEVLWGVVICVRGPAKPVDGMKDDMG